METIKEIALRKIDGLTTLRSIAEDFPFRVPRKKLQAELDELVAEGQIKKFYVGPTRIIAYEREIK